MRTALVAFICGLLAIRFLPFLPSLTLCLGFAVIALVLFWSRYYPVACVLLGVVWSACFAHYAIAHRLDPALDGKTLWLEGIVVDLPEQSKQVVRFQLAHVKSDTLQLPKLIRLSWYKGEAIKTGERWRLKVKLKYPRGTVNPYVFDYEAWLTAKHIGATGMVREGQKLQESGYSDWRYQLREKIQQMASKQAAGIVALVLGDGSGLTPSEWQILQNTGTVHLMVISGQHITLLAGFVYFIVAGLARFGYWPKGLPWLPCACVLAMLGALGYGWLAGFGVPIQRACIMLALVLLWRLRFRHIGIITPFLVTLVVVLCIDPLVSLQAGFWLSFVAVTILLFILAGRLGQSRWWYNILKIELALTIGLFPVLVWLLLPVSVSSPLANLIAVPLVNFIIVPFALLGTLCIWIPYLGAWLLWIAGMVLDGLFCLLTVIANIIPAWIMPMPPWWALLLALFGVFLLLLPRGVPLRCLGVFFCLPLFFSDHSRLQEGYAKVIIFDVGQGLSVLVKTKHHQLLYDTAPRYGDFDIGQRVVLPSLLRLGVSRLDKMIISHADIDHMGGAKAISEAIPVAEILSGEPERLPALSAVKRCEPVSWQWDQVKFSLWQWSGASTSNDASCVLLVEAKGETLLLTGDISTKAEKAWVREQAMKIHWLLAPHHGSRQSSSQTLLDASRPDHIIISRGWLNSFGHPSKTVLKRYHKMHAEVNDTALRGSLSILLGDFSTALKARDQKKFWRKE